MTMLKKVFFGLSTTIVVLILLVGGLWASGKHLELATWGLKEALRSQNFPFHSLAVTKLSSNALEITDISLGDKVLTTDRVVVAFSLETLRSGRVNSLTIQGINIFSHFANGALSIPLAGIMASPKKATGSEAIPFPLPLPVRDVSIDGKLEISADEGALSLPFQFSIKPHYNNLLADFSSTSPWTSLSVRAELPPREGLSQQAFLNGAAEIIQPIDIKKLYPSLPSQAIQGKLKFASDVNLAPVDLRASTSSGNLELDLSTFGEISGRSKGRMIFNSDRRQINLHLQPSFNFRAEIPARNDFTTNLSNVFKPLIGSGKIRASATYASEGTVSIPTSFDDATVNLDQTISFSTDGSLGASGKIRGNLNLSTTPPYLKKIEIQHLNLNSNPFKYNNLKISKARLSASASGNLSRLKGRIKANLGVSGAPASNLHLEGGRLNLDGDYTLNETMLAFHPSHCQEVSFKKLHQGHLLFPKGLDLCLNNMPNTPLLLWDKSTFSIQGEISESELNLKYLEKTTPVVLKGKIPKLSLKTHYISPLKEVKGTLEARGGELSLPSHHIRIAGGKMGGEFSINDQGDIGAEGKIEQLTLSSMASLPPFTPLYLQGQFARKSDNINFETTIFDQTNELKIKAMGRHILDQKRGHLTFALEPLKFVSEGLQPKNLAPIIRGHLSSVDGKIWARGGADWAPSSLQTFMDLSVENLSLSTDIARLEGLDLEVNFDDLWPLSAPPGQTLTIALADVGIPVSQINAVFGINPKGYVEAETIQWPWAGGTMRSRDARFSFLSGDTELTLDVEDLDLEQLLPLLNLEGLTGTGRLSGEIPVSLKPKGASFISEAKLYAVRKGKIQYKSETGTQALGAGGGSAQLLSSALEDFRYDKLEAKINGDLTGEMEIAVHLAGHNPSLYEGYPMELNLNLQGGVNQFLKSGSTITDVPKNLRKQIKGAN